MDTDSIWVLSAWDLDTCHISLVLAVCTVFQSVIRSIEFVVCVKIQVHLELLACELRVLL